MHRHMSSAHDIIDQQRIGDAQEAGMWEERYAQVLDERVRAANVDELAEADLSDDSAELAARGRDTVRGGAVARRERLTGDDERRRVGPEVLEEVREAVEEDERLLGRVRRGELVVAEACERTAKSATQPLSAC